MSSLATGCGSVWLERSVRDAEAARSNRAIPTIKNRRVPVKLEPVFLWSESGLASCFLPSQPGWWGRRPHLLLRTFRPPFSDVPCDGRLGALPFRTSAGFASARYLPHICRERSVDYPLCCSLMGGKWHREKNLSCSPGHIKSGGRQ